MFSYELYSTHRCFRFMLRGVTGYQFADGSRGVVLCPQQNLCSLWAGGANPDSMMTELPGWDAAGAPCPRHACCEPAVTEGLQPVTMINGLTLSYFINFTCSTTFGWRFTTEKHGREHVKKVSPEQEEVNCDVFSCKDHSTKPAHAPL